MGLTRGFGRKRLKNIFDMFDVPVHCWAQYATIHFKCHAKLWLQTYEAQHKIDSWVELCIAIESKFGKDLYHNSMHDLLSIRQTTNVQEYYDRFQSAMHKVLVHNSNLDDVFFVSKFLQGLAPEIRSAIILHKPRTVDVALSLALMQVLVLEAQPKPFFRKSARDFNRAQGKMTIQHQPGILGNPNNEDAKPKWDDKLADLRSQRRAQRLYIKCGEKWNKQHKCPDKISLHVLEEILEAMCSGSASSSSDDSKDDSTDEESEVFQLSSSATEGV